MTPSDDVPVSIRLQSPARPLQPRALHRAALRGTDVPERHVTPVGTLDAGVLADVDAAGAVQVRGALWSLDWWVGAEDRWHHPAREASVRQRVVDASPVVETLLRVPGGDVVTRTYGVQASAGRWRGPSVVVEVENSTAVPVALAFVVRPVTLDGTGAVRSVRSVGADVLVDGSDALLLSRVPARVVVARRAEAADRLAAGEDSTGPVDVVEPGSDAEVAFVVPLPHTAVVKVLLPLPSLAPAGGDGSPPESPWDAPAAEAVARGWSTHAADGPRIVVPEPGWEEGLRWAGAMLRLAGPDEVGACLDRRRVRPAGPSAAVRASVVAEALARLGAAPALDAVARGLAGAQRLGGSVRMGDRSDGTVALVHAVGGALAGTVDPESRLVEDLLAPVAVAVRRLGKGRGLSEGLTASAARALQMLVPALLAIGQPEVAEDAVSAVSRLSGAGSDVVSTDGGQVVGSEQSGPVPTLDAACAARDLIASGGGVGAVAALRHLWAGVSTGGRSDLEILDGRTATSVPAGVLGFDAAELAERTNALLDLFVRQGPDGPVLLSAFDPAWYGQAVEAHGVPCRWGAVGFAVRWHGARPALLWEVGVDRTAVDGVAIGGVGPLVSAPGLDPAWRGTGPSGDALLQAPGAPEP